MGTADFRALSINSSGTANDLARITCHALDPAKTQLSAWERRDIDAIAVNNGPDRHRRETLPAVEPAHYRQRWQGPR